MKNNNHSDTLSNKNIQVYLQDTLGLWLNIPKSSSNELPVMPPHLAARFLRLEEFENDYRDQWNGWDFSYCRSFHEGRLWRADVDHWVESIREEYSSLALRKNKWPNSCGFAVSLTHDVDLFSTQKTLVQCLRKLKSCFTWKDGRIRERFIMSSASFLYNIFKIILQNKKEITELEECLELEKKYNFQASYFFTVYPKWNKIKYDCVFDINDPCKWRGQDVQVKDMIKGILEDGFDIGLHGSFYSALDLSVLREEKERIEGSTNHTISTTRQHYLHWNINKTPQIHEKLGLEADSTLGFNRNVGFRSGTSMPYFMYDLASNKCLNLIQVPLILQDVAIFSDSALGLNMDISKKITLQFIEEVEKVGGVLTVLFHPDRMSDATYKEFYEWFLGVISKKNAWVTNMAQINLWSRKKARDLGYKFK